MENARIVNIDFREFIKVLTEFKKYAKIKSNTVAFLKILNIVEEHIGKPDKEE